MSTLWDEPYFYCQFNQWTIGAQTAASVALYGLSDQLFLPLIVLHFVDGINWVNLRDLKWYGPLPHTSIMGGLEGEELWSAKKHWVVRRLARPETINKSPDHWRPLWYVCSYTAIGKKTPQRRIIPITEHKMHLKASDSPACLHLKCLVWSFPLFCPSADEASHWTFIPDYELNESAVNC